MKKFLIFRVERTNNTPSLDLFDVKYGKTYDAVKKRILFEIRRDLSYFSKNSDSDIITNAFGYETFTEYIEHSIYGYVIPMSIKAKTLCVKYVIREIEIETQTR